MNEPENRIPEAGQDTEDAQMDKPPCKRCEGKGYISNPNTQLVDKKIMWAFIPCPKCAVDYYMVLP